MKREKNYVVYDKETGEAISYHTTPALADAAARKIDAALRKVSWKRITKMQQESDDDTFDAHAYWEADAEGKAAMQRAAVLCECANYTAARRGMKLEQALAIAGEGEG
jgi:hypothetical protein